MTPGQMSRGRVAITSRGGTAGDRAGERPPFEVVTLRQRPDLEDQVAALHDQAWDAFLEGAPWNHWDELFDELAEFQILLRDPDDVVIGLGHTVPFVWDHTERDLPGMLDDIIARALDDRHHGRRPTAFSALAAIVPSSHQNRGLSSAVLRGMLALAGQHHVDTLVAPVGPTYKHLYPLIPMERYVRWTREDGSPFDPWIRVHWRLGAEQLCVAPRTAVARGTVRQWEDWTGMRFPETGLYVVPGALQPVVIDRERDRGRYEDPGIWMRHRVPPELRW
jgi:hypothetical protein